MFFVVFCGVVTLATPGTCIISVPTLALGLIMAVLLTNSQNAIPVTLKIQRVQYYTSQRLPGPVIDLTLSYILVVITIVNVYSMRLSAGLLTWLSSLKILAIAFVVILGMWKLIQRGNVFCFVLCSYYVNSKFEFELHGMQWRYTSSKGFSEKRACN